MYTHGFNFEYNDVEYYCEAHISTTYEEYGTDIDGNRGEMQFQHIIERIDVYDPDGNLTDARTLLEAAGEHFDNYEENRVDWASIEETFFS